jgi:hypothetical protein
MTRKSNKSIRLKLSSSFVALKSLDDDDDDDVDINRTWERIRWNIEASATESVDYYEMTMV